MNAAVRAAVRVAIFKGCRVFGIREVRRSLMKVQRCSAVDGLEDWLFDDMIAWCLSKLRCLFP